MTTRNILPAVRLYTATDPYFYTTDNRPLTDLVSSDQILADAIDNMASNLPFTQSGTGAVSEPIQTFLRRIYYDVKSFGALGDGGGSAASTSFMVAGLNNTINNNLHLIISKVY